MHRPREKADVLKAGITSISLHAILIAMLFLSFNWKTPQPMTVAEVTLWDALPQADIAKVAPEPVVQKPIIEEPAEKPEQPPEEKPELKLEPKIKAVPEALPEESAIVLQKKLELEKLAKQKQLEIDEKKAQALAKKKMLEKEMLDKLKNEVSQEPLREKSTPSENEALKKLQKEALDDAKLAKEAQAKAAIAAVNADIVAEYLDKIRIKIRANVNKSLCGTANPELKFDINLLPTGQLAAKPKLVKSSNSSACDEAVERAIIASEPLPLPDDRALFTEFRKIKLTFKPNE